MRTLKAFTLVELLIVVVIIGAIYAVFGSKFVTSSPTKEMGFEDLQTLLGEHNGTFPVRYVCSGKACDQCTIQGRGGASSEVESFFKEPPELYTLDRYGRVIEKPMEDKQCFEYTMHAPNRGEELLVASDGAYYHFASFPYNTKRYTHIEDAERALKTYELLPKDRYEYYLDIR